LLPLPSNRTRILAWLRFFYSPKTGRGNQILLPEVFDTEHIHNFGRHVCESAQLLEQGMDFRSHICKTKQLTRSIERSLPIEPTLFRIVYLSDCAR
jgi:hypothetical protein